MVELINKNGRPVAAIELYTDGGARGNPGPAAFAAILVNSDTLDIIAELDQTIGVATNNEAEYQGLIAGLKLCREFSPAIVFAHSDSELMIKQMTEEYKVKNERIKILYTKAILAEADLKQVNYTWKPRSHPMISRADELVNFRLDMNQEIEKCHELKPS